MVILFSGCSGPEEPAPEQPHLDADRVDCSRVEQDPPHPGNRAQRLAHAELRERIQEAIAKSGGELGDDGWTHIGPRGFWAGTPTRAPSFTVEHPAKRIRVHLRPVGCGIYRLAVDSNRISQIHGDLEVRFEFLGTAFSMTTVAEGQFFYPNSAENPDQALFHNYLRVRDTLVRALEERLAQSPPGPVRLALLEQAHAVLEPANMKRLGRQFEPTDQERALVQFGRPQSVAVAGKTTLVGTLPMSVALDGQALPVEAMPLSDHWSGAQLGRVVVEGEGVATLALTTPIYDEPHILLSYEPDTLADFTHMRFDMQGPPGSRCVFAAVPIETICGTAAPGQPAWPHDLGCRHAIDSRTGELGQLELTRDTGPQLLRTLLLRPGAYAIDQRGSLSPAKRPCGPAPN